MAWLESLLAGLEVPFPLGFVIVLALALYVLANRIIKRANDPKDPKPLSDKYLVTRNNVIIGIAVSILWMSVTYMTTVGFILAPIILQYLIMAVASGLLASGMSTTVYELIKNKIRLDALLAQDVAEEVTPAVAEAIETKTEAIKVEKTEQINQIKEEIINDDPNPSNHN